MKFDLNAFKKIQDEGDRFAYALENLELLGEGGSRTVFLLSSRFALKVAQNDRGKSQNATEAAISADPKFGQVIARVRQHAPDFSWAVSDLVRPLTSEAEFKNVFGMPFEEFVHGVQGRDSLRWNGGNPAWKVSGRNDPHRDETVGTHGIMQALRELVSSKKLHTPELQFIDHWGKTGDGRIVILDYGVDDGNWKKQTIHAHREGQQRGPDFGQGYIHNSPASESEPILEAFDAHEMNDFRTLLREFVNEVIRKCGDDVCLYTKKKKNGKRRRLGTHRSKKDAFRQELAIMYSKRRQRKQ